MSVPDSSGSAEDRAREMCKGLGSEDPVVVLESLETLRKRLWDGDRDLLHAYLKSSPRCVEVVSAARMKEDKVHLAVVSALCAVLENNEFPDTKRSSAAVAAEMMREHMRSVMHLLDLGALNTTITLRFLSAVAGVDSFVAVELFRRINWGYDFWKIIPSIKTKRDPTKESWKWSAIQRDQRTLYARLLVKFMECGNASVLQGMVDTEVVLRPMFELIGQDPFVLLEFFLEPLKTRVLLNRDIDKRSKYLLFNEGRLRLLASCMSSLSDRRRESALVHSFLSSCASLFADPVGQERFVRSRLELPPRPVHPKAQQLMSLLKALKPFVGGQHHRSVVLEVLKGAPQLVSPYMHGPMFVNVSDFGSSAFLAASALVLDVTREALALPRILPESASEPCPYPLTNLSPLVDMVFPVDASWLRNSLFATSSLAVFRGLEMIIAILRKAAALLFDPVASHASSVATPEAASSWGVFLQAVKGAFKARLPSAQVILSLRSRFVGLATNERGSAALILAHISEAMSLYLRLFPELVLELQLKVFKSDSEDPSSLGSLAQCSFMDLLESSPDLDWPRDPEHRWVLASLLTISGSKAPLPVKRQARHYAVWLLRRAGVVGVPGELESWVQSVQDATVAGAFCDALIGSTLPPEAGETLSDVLLLSAYTDKFAAPVLSKVVSGMRQVMTRENRVALASRLAGGSPTLQQMAKELTELPDDNPADQAKEQRAQKGKTRSKSGGLGSVKQLRGLMTACLDGDSDALAGIVSIVEQPFSTAFARHDVNASSVAPEEWFPVLKMLAGRLHNEASTKVVVALCRTRAEFCDVFLQSVFSSDASPAFTERLADPLAIAISKGTPNAARAHSWLVRLFQQLQSGALTWSERVGELAAALRGQLQHGKQKLDVLLACVAAAGKNKPKAQALLTVIEIAYSLEGESEPLVEDLLLVAAVAAASEDEGAPALLDSLCRNSEVLPVGKTFLGKERFEAVSLALLASPNRGPCLALLEVLIRRSLSIRKPKRCHHRLSLIFQRIVTLVASSDKESSDIWRSAARLLNTVYALDPDLVSQGGQNVLSGIAAAYGATTSATDVAIFKVLRQLDAVGISLAEKGFLWGQPSTLPAEQRPAVKSALFDTKLIDQDKLAETLADFPFQRSLADETIASGAPGAYDPAFLLPVLLRATEKRIGALSFKRFVQLGYLSFVLCSLALTDKSLRLVSHSILENLSKTLEFEFREKDTMSLLFAVVRNTAQTGVDTALNVCDAVFFSRACRILFQSDHPLFSLVSRYLLANPTLKKSEVPLVSVVLSSSVKSSLVAEEHRVWVLETLLASVGHHREYRQWQTQAAVLDKLCIECHGLTADKRSVSLLLAIIKRIAERWRWFCGRDQCQGLLTWAAEAGSEDVVLAVAQQPPHVITNLGPHLVSAALALLRKGPVPTALKVLSRVSLFHQIVLPTGFLQQLCSLLESAYSNPSGSSSLDTLREAHTVIVNTGVQPAPSLVRTLVRTAPALLKDQPEQLHNFLGWLPAEIPTEGLRAHLHSMSLAVPRDHHECCLSKVLAILKD